MQIKKEQKAEEDTISYHSYVSSDLSSLSAASFEI
jgi:hypothetical protein